MYPDGGPTLNGTSLPEPAESLKESLARRAAEWMPSGEITGRGRQSRCATVRVLGYGDRVKQGVAMK